jgi:hypothetical protein
MQSKKINELGTNLAPSINDLTVVGDSSTGQLKKITLNQIASLFGSVGGVSSVAMTVPTGLTVTGSPITTSGTLAVTLTSGYSIPTTAKQAEWDTANADRFKWDGGASGLTASTGRTSLGATTIGSNFFTLTNPSAVTFLRVNADNSISALDAATFRSSIGAGTSSTTGTVTSVAALTLGTTGTDVSSSVANSTTTPVITLNIPTASDTNRGLLSSANWTTFNNKESAIGAGTTSQYWRGDKSWQTLDTTAVTEATNLYYTDARVRAAVSLTTTGSSGSATYSSLTGVFNVPTYTLSGLGGQAQLDGTGFVKASGTTITYDNSTYLTTSSASSTYLTLSGGTLTGALNGTTATFNGSGNRPVTIDSNVNIKADSGGWAMQHGFIGSSNTNRGGFGAYGVSDALSYYYVGLYGSEKMIITNNGSVLIGTTTDAGASNKLQVDGNIYLSYGSVFNFNGSSGPNNILVRNLGSTFSIGGPTIILGSLTSYNEFNTQTTNYTLVLTDASKIIEMNVASSPNTVTVPTNASVAFPIGTEITIMQYSDGVTTIAAASGVTIVSKDNARIIANRYTGATLVKRGTNEWYLIGNIVV